MANTDEGQPRKGPLGPGSVHEAVDAFTFEVALLFFRMSSAATELLGEGKHSSGRRSVLRSLGADGPQTVPSMARARTVSRQHIQKLVNELKADGLVKAMDNPAHKRSVLISLTSAGKRFLDQMKATEIGLFEELAEGRTPADFHQATELVRTVRERLEGLDWNDIQRAGGAAEGESTG